MRKNKVVVWVKGNFAVQTHLPAKHLIESFKNKDSVSLALRITWYFLYHFERDWITLDEWRMLSLQKLGLSDEFAYFLFTVATGTTAGNEQGRCHFLNIALVLAFQSSQGDDGRGGKTRSSADFVKRNLDKLLTLCFLFDKAIQKQFIQTPDLDRLPVIPAVTPQMLRFCDDFLEGTLIDKAETQSHGCVRPFKFSDLMNRYSFNGVDEIPFTVFLKQMLTALQSDMYGLDELELLEKRVAPPTSTRTLTSTALPEHRKLSLRHWSHMELLTSLPYRCSNLRVIGGSPNSGSSFVFHLGVLKSAVIADCTETAPIVLGPVTDFVVLKNLRGCRISVITKRVLIIDCDDLLMFLESKDRPIICGNAETICFAPYNVWYDALETELSKSKLQLGNDKWDDPVIVKSAYQHCSKHDKSTVRCQILEPEDFYLQPTPFVTNELFSNPFKHALGEYLTCWNKRKHATVDRIKTLTEKERSLLSPIGVEDSDYLKKRIK